ncbi:hypothetical protein [uncultured Clostridium sp.]|uniref:hypothetical protein n=1 Tax=uncultured Clostridium sp. TaxID=59620 RepID=UPI00261ACAC7|nr:hypothetical protein [uncultured Clostridium sp.]
MTKQAKTAIYFFISIIVLTYTFFSFTNSVLTGLIIGSFISLFLFYDPKKIKKKSDVINTDSINSKS